MTGWWKAPRQLARMLAARELTFNAYGLLHYLAESGADREDGFVTSNGALADLLGLSERTIRRTLRALRAGGFIEYADHAGSAAFTVRTSPWLAALPDQPRTAPRTPETEVVSEVTSDTPAPTGGRKPASAKGNPADTTSDSSRARAETETYNYRYYVAAHEESGEALERRPNPQALVASFVDQARELGAEPPRRVIGQVARQLGQLVDEGYDAPTLERALAIMLERRLNPSTLSSLIVEAQAGPPKPRPRARPEHVSELLLRNAGIDPQRLLEGGGEGGAT